MKKTLLITALLGALSSSIFVPASFAHDELGDVNVEKGTHREPGESSLPVLEGSKNVKFLKEVAAINLKEIDGKKMTTADVYAHKGFAYVGTHTAVYGTSDGGVRVFDLKDPSNPKEVAVFAHNDVPGTWQEKVIVKSVSTPYFKGDLAVVSVQKVNRTSNSSGGFLLYDVSNPYEPKKLGFYSVTNKTRGTHELYLTTQGNQALVLAANPYADYYSHGEEKDFQIVDVTNPLDPKKVWEFDPRLLPEVPDDFNGYHWNAPDGKTRPVFSHSAIADETGRYAFVSMWDLGTVILDIQNPEKPVYLGRTQFRANQKGAAHSAALAKGGTVLIETREVANPTGTGYESAYGYTRIYDIKDKTNPKLLSEFTTDLTFAIPKDESKQVTFANTVHDPKVRGNTLYLSHYAGGVRVVDINDPSNPVEIGKYIPENADIWGVFVDRNYILASDLGRGLKVLQKSNSEG